MNAYPCEPPETILHVATPPPNVYARFRLPKQHSKAACEHTDLLVVSLAFTKVEQLVLVDAYVIGAHTLHGQNNFIARADDVRGGSLLGFYERGVAND